MVLTGVDVLDLTLTSRRTVVDILLRCVPFRNNLIFFNSGNFEFISNIIEFFVGTLNYGNVKSKT